MRRELWIKIKRNKLNVKEYKCMFPRAMNDVNQIKRITAAE